jgi:hypothetical protein
MATRMSCHDAVRRYELFLHWVKGEGIIDKIEDIQNNNDDDKDDVEVRGCRGYKVAKKPGYGNVTVEDLINNGTADEHFLRTHSIPVQNRPPPFGVFKRLSVTLPQIPQVSDLTDLRDTIRMIWPKPPQGRKEAIPAQFDTVLVFEKAGLTAFADPLDPFKGTFL